jgi:dTDP-4-amino-4,6-dideoxygalactose transaminase
MLGHPQSRPGASIPTVPIYKALIGTEEREAADQALRQGWLGMGTYVGEFELAVEKVIGGGCRRALAVGTGYAALHLGLIAAGVGDGDEVIVPSFTHLADVQAIRAVGARPVLCDILDTTLCLDPARVADLVGPRTRAILTMDYGPHLADHASLAEIARAHDLRVVHDAAHSFGSSRDDAMVGSFSDICMFSFDPVKAVSCVDAGVVVVRGDHELDRLRSLRVLGADHPAEMAYGQARSWHFDVVEPGYRYHLSNLHAAIGLAQLAKLDTIRWSRQAACEHYRSRLGAIEGLAVPGGDLGGMNPFLFYVRVRGGRRQDLREHLADLGIETGIHWLPVHQTTLFGGCRQGPLPVTAGVAREIVSLPLHSCMPEEVLEWVCDGVLSFFG